MRSVHTGGHGVPSPAAGVRTDFVRFVKPPPQLTSQASQLLQPDNAQSIPLIQKPSALHVRIGAWVSHGGGMQLSCSASANGHASSPGKVTALVL